MIGLRHQRRVVGAEVGDHCARVIGTALLPGRAGNRAGRQHVRDGRHAGIAATATTCRQHAATGKAHHHVAYRFTEY